MANGVQVSLALMDACSINGLGTLVNAWLQPRLLSPSVFLCSGLRGSEGKGVCEVCMHLDMQYDTKLEPLEYLKCLSSELVI